MNNERESSGMPSGPGDGARPSEGRSAQSPRQEGRQSDRRGGGGPRGNRPNGGSSGPRPGGARPQRSGPPSKGGKRKLAPQQLRQAKMMTEQSGIPFSQAVRVVTGKATLNEVLQELLRETKIQKLMETHEINRALATNIALGRTDLNVVLLRRRKNHTLQEHYTQSCLDEAFQKKHTLAVGLHGHRKLIGRIVGVEKYTIQFLEDKASEPIELHKTEIKFAYDPEQYKVLRKHMDLRKDVKIMNLSPILRAKERHHFKNLSLQQSIDERREVQITTLEGDTFQGVVDWFGRWEFVVKFKGGARVSLFRHAIYELKLLAARHPTQA